VSFVSSSNPLAPQKGAKAYQLTSIASEIAREVTGLMYIAVAIMMAIFARSTEKGSRTLVHAASQGSAVHGQYMSDCQIARPSSFVQSPTGLATEKRVWDELARKLEAIKPGIASNL
jgi:retinol dehydrogenase 12